MADPDVVDLFENPNAPTDMTFEVEGKIIPFYKALLTISSPVFGRMLTSNFKEAQTNTVRLPDKTLDEIIFFLEQLHPAHAWKPLKEERLECLLTLADKYDVAPVRMKCQAFIREQLEFDLTTEQMLKYLWLCDTYSLNEVRADVITVAVDHTQTEMEACSYFSKLNTSTRLEVISKLCRSLQNRHNTDFQNFTNTRKFVRKLKGVVTALPALIPDDARCESCIEKDDGVFYLSFSALKEACRHCLNCKVAKVLQAVNEKFTPLRKSMHTESAFSVRM